MEELRVVDLFCGMGGFSQGFKEAGFKIVMGIDNDKKALNAFNKNFPTAEVLCKDIRDVHLLDLPECDVIIGSPPCQEWSPGKNEKRTFDTSLISEFQRLAVKAKHWCWENAWTTEVIKPCIILDAVWFGVPQYRRRAFHANFNIEVPKAKWKVVTVNEALGFKETVVLFNHRSLNTEAHTPVYLSNRPARTLTTIGITIYKERKLTESELRKIMGCPASMTGNAKQLGNAVCPPVARHIASQLRGDTRVVGTATLDSFA